MSSKPLFTLRWATTSFSVSVIASLIFCPNAEISVSILPNSIASLAANFLANSKATSLVFETYKSSSVVLWRLKTSLLFTIFWKTPKWFFSSTLPARSSSIAWKFSFSFLTAVSKFLRISSIFSKINLETLMSSTTETSPIFHLSKSSNSILWRISRAISGTTRSLPW